MNLLEYFNQEPEGVVTMDIETNGITKSVQFIPILKLKEMLNNHFSGWSTSKFKWEYIMRGNEFYITSSVSLNLLLIVDDIEYKTSFVGAATINILSPNPTMEVNENHAACALSAAIKNAAKNIGKKFGMYLNADESFVPNYEQPKEPNNKRMNKAITNILNNKNKN